MGSRSLIVSFRADSFTEIVERFDKRVNQAINAHAAHFEKAWRASRHDGELPDGFEMEQDTEIVGPFQLYQIRVGPGRGYRADVMFLHESPEAYWVYAFKKGKRRQPEDMERARVLAQRQWEKIKRSNEGIRKWLGQPVRD